MKKSIMSITLSFSLGAMSMSAQAIDPEMVKKAIDEMGVEKVLSITAGAMTKNIPIQIDSYTTLESMVALGRTLQVRSTVKGGFDGLVAIVINEIINEAKSDPEFPEVAIPIFESWMKTKEGKDYIVNATESLGGNLICSTPTNIPLMDAGAKMSYAYYDDEMNHMASYTFDKESCSNRKTIDEVWVSVEPSFIDYAKNYSI